MKIGHDPGFIAICYSESGAEREWDGEASINTHAGSSFDCRIEKAINKHLETSIHSDTSNEIDDFPGESINDWENDYYQPNFEVNTATPSRRKIRVCVT